MQSSPDESVDLSGLDVVHAVDGILDLPLVAAHVNDENKGVVVLDLLHGALGGERVLKHAELIHLVDGRHRLARVLGLAGEAERLRAVEGDAGADLARKFMFGDSKLLKRVYKVNNLAVLGDRALLDGLSDLSGLSTRGGGGSLLGCGIRLQKKEGKSFTECAAQRESFEAFATGL